MGYTTKFKGELRFKKQLTVQQLAALSNILGEDSRDHPEWNERNFIDIDLELTKDYTALQWNGAEKSYNMQGQINLIIRLMQQDDNDFGLEGALLAQGEEIGDVYKIAIENNIAVVHEIKI